MNLHFSLIFLFFSLLKLLVNFKRRKTYAVHIKFTANISSYEHVSLSKLAAHSKQSVISVSKGPYNAATRSHPRLSPTDVLSCVLRALSRSAMHPFWTMR